LICSYKHPFVVHNCPNPRKARALWSALRLPKEALRLRARSLMLLEIVMCTLYQNMNMDRNRVIEGRIEVELHLV